MGLFSAIKKRQQQKRFREWLETWEGPSLQLHGLNGEDAIRAVWKLLFSPALQKHFGSGQSLEWTKKLIAKFAEGDQSAFSAQYNSLIPEVKAALSIYPKYSILNPPWSMVSLDMRVGLIPWTTPLFDKGFAILLKSGSALEKHFGDVLPFAYFLRGGPGDSPENAFRVCAPTNAVRASAEHWLMRAYLCRKEEGSHATVGLDKTERMFSEHRYMDVSGIWKRMYFETTDSMGREEEDFRDFLQGNV